MSIFSVYTSSQDIAGANGPAYNRASADIRNDSEDSGSEIALDHHRLSLKGKGKGYEYEHKMDLEKRRAQ